MQTRMISGIVGLLIPSIVLIGFTVSPAAGQGGWTDAGTVVHLTTQTDRVGIGTTDPQRKLHVAGAARVSGALEVRELRSLGNNSSLVLRLGSRPVVRLLQANGETPNVIAGHEDSEAMAGVMGAVIAGGGADGEPNIVTDHFGTVGGGAGNQAGDGVANPDTAPFATVAGGRSNTAGGFLSTAGGGQNNAAGGFASTVGGGQFNRATGVQATVSGGQLNEATGTSAAIVGGESNRATGLAATVAGGRGNAAAGAFSFAAGGSSRADFDSSFALGTLAVALHSGAFVWADNSVFAEFPSTAERQFRARATGGAQFVTAVDSVGGPTAGVRLGAGGSFWLNLSDRSLKENVTPVDGRDILRRLSAVPITQWNLRAQDPAIKHLGPMAQDFYAAFGLGEDERYIGTGDAQGVALVSIQALYEMALALERNTAALEQKTAALERKTEQVDRLAQRLAELEARVGRAAASR